MNPSVLSRSWPGRLPHVRRLASGQTRAYVRFVALGDSATCGFEDPVLGGVRGWSRILAEAIAQEHDISYCDLAVTGSTAEAVWLHQVSEAVNHRPHMASLIVGLSDTLGSDWDVNDVRDRVLRSADELAWCGCALLTARFHDHDRVLGLSGHLARPLGERIEQLNQVYDEIHRDYDTIHLDLTDEPAAYDRRFWMPGTVHPSGYGHRVIADRFGQALAGRGLWFERPAGHLYQS